MPYPLQILDAETLPYNLTAVTSWPLTVGSSFVAGDMRVCVLTTGTGFSATTPPGWSVAFNFTATAGTSSSRIIGYTKKLTDTDVDYPMVSTSAVGGSYQAWTVRNPNLGQALSCTAHYVEIPAASTPVSEVIWNSIPVTANSIMIMCGWAVVSGADSTSTILTPTGCTELAKTQEADTASYQLVSPIYARGYSTAGSSGINQSDVYYSPGTPPSPYAAAWEILALNIVFAQNPDVSVSIGTATAETDTVPGALTATNQNLVSFQIGTAVSEIDTANQVATPLTGYRISPPLALPQSPITNSVIHWDPTTIAVGSTVTVESSIDNGATWQLCTNDEPIPRLIYGYNVATTLLTRVTLYRARLTDPTPTVANLEVRVATDSSEDELVSLGVFYITSTEITMSGGSGTGSSGSGGGGSGVTGSGGGSTGGALSIQISGVDQSRQVSRNTWQDVYYIPANTNYATAIQQIIDNRLPGLQYNFQSTPMKTPKIILGTQLGNDPWQDAQDMATAIGFELFFDAAGICTLREIPDPATGQSVWTFSDQANPTIAQLDRTLTDQTTYNYVICYGESVDNTVPVQAVAFDNDPNSPTYYLGPYGIVSTTFQSAMITTTAQAQAAANALLLAVKGASENVALTVVPNPALEPGDVVTVEVADAQISGTFLVNDIQTPLSAAQGQTLTVYRQSS